jgi:hypothetical protein
MRDEAVSDSDIPDEQNLKIAVQAQRIEAIEKLQKTAASYMRLNAVWGLEPSENAKDIRKARVDTKIANDGGVKYKCLDEERKVDITALGDSDLDRMILLF